MNSCSRLPVAINVKKAVQLVIQSYGAMSCLSRCRMCLSGSFIVCGEEAVRLHETGALVGIHFYDFATLARNIRGLNYLQIDLQICLQTMKTMKASSCESLNVAIWYVYKYTDMHEIGKSIMYNITSFEQCRYLHVSQHMY